MDLPLVDFVLASVLMGLGIGADVAIATLSRAHQLTTLRLVVVWVLGVSLTHTLFPMAGYLLTYFSIQVQPAITPVIGILAALCIWIYLHSEFRQLWRPEASSDNAQMLVTLGLILAVSWDALWSGPAKSAQVIGWPELLVWVSFIVVGLMVAALAIGSVGFARRFAAIGQRWPVAQWFGLWVQYSVIAYFGLLAVLRYTLDADIGSALIFVSALLVIGGLLLLCQKRQLISETS